MQTRVSLALANKLRMLFEAEDRFLTYPMGVGFSYRYLDFMKELSVSGLSAVEQLNYRGDFARLLNLIPQDGIAYSPDGSRYLWNEMKDVLVQANYAASGLTAAETQQLDEAIDFLTDQTVTPDGTKIGVYSPAVSAYYTYKTTYEAADKSYLDEKITVENTAGPEGDQLREQWKAYREKELLDFRQKAMQDWTALGNKLQVEHCQAVQRSLEPRKYLNLQGQSYLDDLAVSEIADINGVGIGFFTTFFSPIDIFDKNTKWSSINLTKGEIDKLVETAPADLKAIFNPGADGSDGVEAVSLEYSNAVVLRPWYHPEFFDARCWDLAGGAVVSDGNVPRKGRLPAHVTSLLAVRNIVCTKKKSAQGAPVVLHIINSQPLTQVRFVTAAAPLPAAATMTASPRSAAMRVDAASGAARVGAPAARPAAVSALSAQPGIVAPMRPAPTPARPVDTNRFVVTKYGGTTIKTPVVDVPPKRPPPNTGNPPGDLVQETYHFDGVAVLAYVCKRIPKSPNPDKTLQWA